MRIVDAHHHLWDLEALDYPWLMARGVRRFFGDPTPIQRNYLVADLRDDARDYQLVGSVHVQVGVAEGEEIRETAWLETTAARDGLPSAIVGFCDLTRDDVSDVLDAHAAHSRFRGIRQIIGRSADEDARTGSGQLIDDARWSRGLRELAGRGMSFDLQLVPEQMPRVAELFAQLPELDVALCHCGSPWDQSRAGLRAWRHGLERLASLPRMRCKLSGLGMFDHDWTTASIRPVIETCIEVFGPGRCMFGSNFPVDKLHRGYSDVWRAFEDIVAPLREPDRDRLFAGTAIDFYRLGLEV